jgi:hypothetical protein
MKGEELVSSCDKPVPITIGMAGTIPQLLQHSRVVAEPLNAEAVDSTHAGYERH